MDFDEIGWFKSSFLPPDALGIRVHSFEMKYLRSPQGPFCSALLDKHLHMGLCAKITGFGFSSGKRELAHPKSLIYECESSRPDGKVRGDHDAA
jgi:hypothetical protein